MNVEEFFKKFFPQAYQYFTRKKVFPEKDRITLSIESVEELYIKIHISNLVVQNEFRFLKGICRINFIKHIQELDKKRKLIKSDDSTSFINNFPDQSISNPEVKFLKNKEIEIIWDAINQLKNPQKLIIEMFYFGDKTSKEIAKILNLSDSNVRKILERARILLKQILESKEIKWI